MMYTDGNNKLGGTLGGELRSFHTSGCGEKCDADSLNTILTMLFFMRCMRLTHRENTSESIRVEKCGMK